MKKTIWIVLLSGALATLAQAQINIYGGVGYSRFFNATSIDFYVDGALKNLNNIGIYTPGNAYGGQVGIHPVKWKTGFELSYARMDLIAAQCISNVWRADYDRLEIPIPFHEFQLRTCFQLTDANKKLSAQPFLSIGLLSLVGNPIVDQALSVAGVQESESSNGHVTLSYQMWVSNYIYHSMNLGAGLRFHYRIVPHVKIWASAGYQMGLKPVIASLSAYRQKFDWDSGTGALENGYATSRADRLTLTVGVNYEGKIGKK